MKQIDKPVRTELLSASDDVIEDALTYADPMVLRGLIYQITGDNELKDIELVKKYAGFTPLFTPATEAGTALIRQKAAAFLKRYRDAGAGAIDIGPKERLPESLSLICGRPLSEVERSFYLEELALDPWVRALQWKTKPAAKQLADFNVAIIGAGMGGLSTALMLKRAGIPYTVIEKNDDVGGTWHENRYPGARVDTPSRGYTHIIGVDFPRSSSFCPQNENKAYFDWVADAFDVRKDILFNTEVHALSWNESDAVWEISVKGPAGSRVLRARAVITAVGFLNRPNIPNFPGAGEFRGQSWHTARWPQDKEWRGKRIVVIGTGATGYQMVPELALEAAHVTVFQRTAQWVFPSVGYRSQFVPQVSWLDRNFPYLTNFLRFRTVYRGPDLESVSDIDPNFEDPHTLSPANKIARDTTVNFIKQKIPDPKLAETMIPTFPPLAGRPIVVDPEYSIMDAIQRDNVTLVTSAIKRMTPAGIEDADGTHHDADIIVYATGFHATEYLFPMTITGRGGKTIDQLWEKDGARAYLGAMMPGFPNLWATYGPNTNGFLAPAGLHELTALYAMQCIERALSEGKRSIEVKEGAYWRYNHYVDERNSKKVWSDPRAHNYYWSQCGRSAVMNPLEAPLMASLLRRPDFADLVIQ
jgi:4-hydroxyacetophenone monooxygenase